MKMLGEEGDNLFTNAAKLSEIERRHDDITDNPIIGLKRDIIRLIANMVHGNRQNQDQVKAKYDLSGYF